jgi:hypothetical protein
MDGAQILEVLQELASEAGFEIRRVGSGRPPEDDPPIASGVCRLRGRVWVVLSGSEPLELQIDVLAGALRKHAGTLLEDRYLPPAVRARIELEDGSAFDSA